MKFEMKYLYSIFPIIILFFFACKVQKKAINPASLNIHQVKQEGEWKTKPGKCYTKMMSTDGILEFYEFICPTQKTEYELAANCLKKLGYVLIENSNFKTVQGNALIDFQKKYGLAYGALDEATLYLLIQKSNIILK